MLDYYQNEPISGERKNSFEYRQACVPRLLFRVWSKRSGGGPGLTTNSPTEIVPHAYMNGAPGRGFYDVPERELFETVHAHYYGNVGPESPLSEFSSWTASLHLALWYAHSIPEKCDPHIAVMDRHRLDEETLIWHVPDLLQDGGIHEYLAHGRIKGIGYTAVPLRVLQNKGLLEIFAEFRYSSCDTWGEQLRRRMFERPPESMTATELTIVKKISALFGNLSLPVAVSLLCLRPRPWCCLRVTMYPIDQARKMSLEYPRYWPGNLYRPDFARSFGFNPELW